MNKEKELFDKLFYLIKKKKTVQEIAETLEVSTYEVLGIANLMKERGYMIDYVDGKLVRIKKQVELGKETFIRDNSEHVRVLMISDTHLCNKADRVDILKYLYAKCEEEGVKYVLHSGDLTDGYYPNRPQQIYELKAHGYDQQLDYVVNKYPFSEYVQTYFITGNHDFTHIRNGGGDIGKAISNIRKDMIYLGPDRADITLGKTKIHLFHGTGGKPYSMSYKLQRYMETLKANTYDIVQKGHTHDAFYMYYMAMHGFQTGAMVGETQYSKQCGFKNEISVWWVDIYTDQKGKPYSIIPKQEIFTKKRVNVKRLTK